MEIANCTDRCYDYQESSFDGKPFLISIFEGLNGRVVKIHQELNPSLMGEQKIQTSKL